MITDRTYCDFLLLAPLALEIEALTDALINAGWTKHGAPATPEFPDVGEWAWRDEATHGTTRRVVLARLNHQGVLNASVDTARLLQLYEPGYIVSFGIAGSLDPIDAPLGSVVFATGVVYYEPSKDQKSSTKSRMTHVPVGEALLNPFRQLRIRAKLVDGPIASGEKVLADINSTDRKRIVAANDKTLAVEMESAGVGRAAQRLCFGAELVVIKGISDLADRKKGAVPPDLQIRHRRAAARNVASCLIALLSKAPLRRHWRSQPHPHAAGASQVAERETRALLNALAPFGIKGDLDSVYACLHGRRSLIPVYYHWKQKSVGLHWIDLKLLLALQALPKDVVTPVPIVSVREAFTEGSWKGQVRGLLGVEPITSDSLREQQDELSTFVRNVGFTSQAEDELRAFLQEMHAGRADAYLNVMRYMLGQFSHRRMFVFTWNSMRTKWTPLSRAIGTAFAILDWDTMQLAGEPGKQKEPGRSLTIEPGSYQTIRDWLSSNPDPDTVAEFVAHFEPLLTNGRRADPMDAIEDLLSVWDKTLNFAV